MKYAIYSGEGTGGNWSVTDDLSDKQLQKLLIEERCSGDRHAIACKALCDGIGYYKDSYVLLNIETDELYLVEKRLLTGIA